MTIINKKSPPEYQVSEIMIWVYHDLSNCDYTLNDSKNQFLCDERRKTYMVYSHNNLLYGGLL